MTQTFIERADLQTERRRLPDQVDIEALGIDQGILDEAYTEMETKTPDPKYSLKTKQGMVTLRKFEHEGGGTEQAWVYNEIGYGPRKFAEGEPRLAEYREIIHNMVKKTMAEEILETYTLFPRSIANNVHSEVPSFKNFRDEGHQRNFGSISDEEYEETKALLEKISQIYQVSGTATIIGPAGSGKTTLLKELKAEGISVVDEEFRHLVSNQYRGFQIIEFPERKKRFLFCGDKYMHLDDIPDEILDEQISAIKNGDLAGSTFLRLYAYINSGIYTQVNLLKGLQQANFIINSIDTEKFNDEKHPQARDSNKIHIHSVYFDKFINNLVYTYKSLGEENLPREILDLLKCMPIIPRWIVNTAGTIYNSSAEKGNHRRQALEQGDVTQMYSQIAEFYQDELGVKVFSADGEMEEFRKVVSDIKEEDLKSYYLMIANAIGLHDFPITSLSMRPYTDYDYYYILPVLNRLGILSMLPEEAIKGVVSEQSVRGLYSNKKHLIILDGAHKGLPQIITEPIARTVELADLGLKKYISEYQEKINDLMQEQSQIGETVREISEKIIDLYDQIRYSFGTYYYYPEAKPNKELSYEQIMDQIHREKNRLTELIREIKNDPKKFNLENEKLDAMVESLATTYVDLFGSKYISVVSQYIRKGVGRKQHGLGSDESIYFFKLMWMENDDFLEELSQWIEFLAEKSSTISAQDTILYTLANKTILPTVKELIAKYKPVLNFSKVDNENTTRPSATWRPAALRW